MLEEIRIQNSRCLRDVTLQLSPVTVLVGPNASGKSAILKLLNGDGGTPWRKGKGDPDIQWKAKPRTWLGSGAQSWQNFRNRARKHHQMLHLQVEKLRSENKLQETVSLNAVGDNLTNAFYTLSRKQQIALSEQFCQLIPVFQDVDTRPTSNGRHKLVFQDAYSDTWFDPAEVSDGSMLVLAYLTLQHAERKVRLVCIEEPERGLHPWREASPWDLEPAPGQALKKTNWARLTC